MESLEIERSHVKVWEERIKIPTYSVGEADKNPLFLEKRVYQGSSGSVYPFPCTFSISTTKDESVEYNVVFLENEYIKVMVMPSLGGRVHMAVDKTNDFNFVYHNQVIKPALVGLTGSWISGGIEFNWPQHHRPSTFDHIDYTIEEKNPHDGSQTLWVSEIERMTRTKCLLGFTIYPGKSVLELNVHIFNRTYLPQSFLFWANPAMHVDKHYQSIFPPDVSAVYDHGKKDVSSFPIATGQYYKVDYSSGVDISRYVNIPVPTSFMVASSEYDFIGGYDHSKKAGMLHYCDHHISPGKKQWVWGCGSFGKVWDSKNLTDEDGPYVELMCGVYTDNQPDFSWLMPFEEKSWKQYFFPYKNISNVKNANESIAVNMERRRGGGGDDSKNSNSSLYIGIYATRKMENIRIEVSSNENVMYEENLEYSLGPRNTFEKLIEDFSEEENLDLNLKVFENDCQLVIEYSEITNRRDPSLPLPSPAEAMPCPKEIGTSRGALFFSNTSRTVPTCNLRSIGLLRGRRGRFEIARNHFEKALERQNKYNSNPINGECHYNLGIVLKYLGRLDESYKHFFKSTWNDATMSSAYFCLGQICSIWKKYELALEHVEKSLSKNSLNHKARHLKIIILRKLKRIRMAKKELEVFQSLDILDFGSLFEKYKVSKKGGKYKSLFLEDFKKKTRLDVHNLIEISLDYWHCGCIEEAMEILQMMSILNKSEEEGEEETNNQISPLVYYFMTLYSGNEKYLRYARECSSDYCFPHRLECLLALQNGVKLSVEKDAKDFYYLGLFWYSKRQYDLSIECWETSRDLDGSFATVHRNLGLAYFNKRKKSDLALKSYEIAYELDPSDARVLFELDQLKKMMNLSNGERMEFLKKQEEVVVTKRDDLYVEYIWLLNITGKHESALDCLIGGEKNKNVVRIFHPWEGGEGKVTGSYVYAKKEISKKLMVRKEYSKAAEILERLIQEEFPENLSEGKLHGRKENDLHYFLAVCFREMNIREDKYKKNLCIAAEHFSRENKMEEKVEEEENENVLKSTVFYNDQPPEQIFYKALALEELGSSNTESKKVFERFVEFGKRHLDDEVKIDYFAVSLPDFLVFDQDLVRKNRVHATI